MIVVIDSNHLCHMFWHIGAAEIRKQTGNKEAVADIADALEHFLIRLDNLKDYASQMIIRLRQKGIQVADLQMIAAFDSPSRLFRKVMMPEYKGNRERNEGAYELVADAIRAIDSSQDWTLRVSPPGFEADDLIASIAFQSDDHVLIHSPDKDFNQCLIQGRVGIIKRSAMMESDEKNDHGLALGNEMVAKHYTEYHFKKEFGFPVDRWIDYQALCGDSADNIKGAKWIGDVAARKIIIENHDQDLEQLEPDQIGLNKRQVAGWDDFIERLPLLREILTLRTTLKLERK